MITGQLHRSGMKYENTGLSLDFPSTLAVILLFLGIAAPVYGNQILIVQSSELLPYHQAAEGVVAALDPLANRQGPKALLPVTVDKVILDTTMDDEAWRQRIAQIRPSAIVAVGKRALELAVYLRDIPVVYAMVPGAEQIIDRRKNTSGVSMLVPAETILTKLRNHHPHVHRILVLYHPVYSGKFIAAARDAALRLDLELIAMPVSAPQEAVRLLNAVQEKVQALWMIPDPNVLNNETMQSYLDYSLKKRIILLTFAEKYLKIGATFGIALDNTEMGRAAGRMALSILEGKGSTSSESNEQVVYRVFQNTDLIERMAALDDPRHHFLP